MFFRDLHEEAQPGRELRRFPDGQRYVFITNNFRLASRTVADLKNLKIKSFVGATINSVLTQIWVALCVYLLLACVKFANKLAASMQRLLGLLHLNVFQRLDLLAPLRGDARDPLPKWQQNQLVLV